MNRVKYVITKPDGATIEAWGNGYEVNQAGILSIGQMASINGQMVPLLVLSLQPSQWVSIHQIEHGRPAYESIGTIQTSKVVVGGTQ